MATIRASCGTCGDVEITSGDVSVRVCRDNGAGSYAFACPSCDLIVVKAAEPRIIELLVSSGVSFVTWDVPAEMHETHEGDPISHDDLLDFHELLSGDEWIEALARLTTG